MNKQNIKVRKNDICGLSTQRFVMSLATVLLF